MSEYLFYGHEFQWGAYVGRINKLSDGTLHDIDPQNMLSERKVLIEAIELWLKRC